MESEGLVAIVLQRAADAKKIYAKLNHVEVSSIYSGPSLVKQTTKSWEKILTDFYKKSKIDVNDVCFVEAYGGAVKVSPVFVSLDSHDQPNNRAVDQCIYYPFFFNY